VIAPTTGIGARPHRVRVQNPDPPVLVDGSYTQTWHDADPPFLFVAIQPASAPDLERSEQGTVIAMGTHVVVGPFHPQITTQTRLLLSAFGLEWTTGQRTFHVLGASSPDLRQQELSLLVAEVVT
jgi:head-tail adaptor